MSTSVKTFSWLLDFFPKRFIQLQFKFTVSSYPVACRFHVHKDNSLCVNIEFKMSERLAVVTTKRTCLYVDKVIPENTEK